MGELLALNESMNGCLRAWPGFTPGGGRHRSQLPVLPVSDLIFKDVSHIVALI